MYGQGMWKEERRAPHFTRKKKKSLRLRFTHQHYFLTLLKQEEMDERTALCKLRNRQGSSNFSSAAFNVINSIIGSGMIGLPYSLKQAGFPLGILLLLGVACITDYSIILLIKGGHLSGTNSYQALVNKAYGFVGHLILSALQFLYPFIAMISYNIITGDTLTKVFQRIPGVGRDNLFIGRHVLILCVTIIFTLPLSLYRNISKLGKVSFISIILTIVILVIGIIRTITFSSQINRKLKLNPDKTEVLLVGGSGFGEGELNLVLNGVALPPRDKVHSLGVLLDPELSLEAQVTVVARSAFLQLRLIHQLRPYLEYDCLATVTHALVTSRLDFCNALYVGLPLKMVRILQLVQNRAARLLTGTGRYVHMTPVLRQLHWLPIEVRAQFKVLVMTYKALNGLGPGYLKERLHPYMSARPLRSVGEALLREPSMEEIRRVVTRRRAFSAVAPKLWNVLPREVRLAPKNK
ncbi:putative sodium-coupled neutral amino acid transporter 11 [Varanus komodoensis]|nr:putative sodium-coupled neutral amino acid transporter 11 [Varanus komodoensis]